MMEQRERSTSIARRLAGLALAGCLLAGAAPTLAAAPAGEMEALGLTLTRAATATQSRCGPPQMSTPGIECQGFAGREILSDTSIFVVGFENQSDLREKHVYQAVATFDLTPLQGLPEGAKVAKASLGYDQASATRRSATGDSEYGILPTCATRLGLATAAWTGALDKVVPTTAAKVAGHAPATTAEHGSWDVTPQVEQWAKDKTAEATFVMRPEDETLDVKGQQMCLSYHINLSLDVEYELPQ